MLDGFFAFVILDKRTNTFYAARDPIGITCMYIGWGKDGSVWLSSEMKCLKVWGMCGSQCSLWGRDLSMRLLCLCHTRLAFHRMTAPTPSNALAQAVPLLLLTPCAPPPPVITG